MRLADGSIPQRVCVFVALILCPFNLRAAEFDQGPILTIAEENDFVNGTDRWYTQAAQITFLQGDNHLPHWTQSLFQGVPALGFSTSAERFGYQLGQSTFTPSNTRSSDFLPNDRPYAGWLYAGLIYQRRGMGLGDYLTLENFRLDIGIIGPESLGGQMQTWWHHQAPRGWEYQLKDEPGLALKYGRAWILPLPSAEQRFLDIIPHAGLSVGNVDTSFRVGGTLRAGVNLPDDIGIQPIHSLFSTEGGRSTSHSTDWGFYLFGGVEGRAVLYDAFLDGNAFRESPHVDKEDFVGEARLGLVLLLKRIELAYTHLFSSRDFEKQPVGQIYGSLTIKVKF